MIMVIERYLVLNRHGTSIMKTFLQKQWALIRDFRCVAGHIFLLKTVPGLRIEKYSEIIENIRITMSKTIITKIV